MRIPVVSELYLLTVPQKTPARREGYFSSKDTWSQGRKPRGLQNKALINFGPDFQLTHVQFFYLEMKMLIGADSFHRFPH